MVHEDPTAELTGYICPRCGGAISQRTDGDGVAGYQCRIKHAFTPEQFWVETCAMRNTAVAAAVRAIAEKVDLARALSREARNLGNDALAARLEAEAEERRLGPLLAMLEDLVDDETTDGTAR